MTGEKPLRAIVTAKNPLVRLEVAPRVISALRDQSRIAASAAGGGVTVSCIWYPDFDRAVEIVNSAIDHELVWSQPEVEYRFETIERGGRAVEVMLEPMLLVEVTCPPDFIGNVIGDLCSRRAMVTGQRDNLDNTMALQAEAPLAELRGYDATLAQIANRTARASAEFHSYARYIPRPGSPPDDEPMSAALRA
jgi:hypothetical protein